MPGFLYRIAEDTQPEDVIPHPRSAMECGNEWITKRELAVVLVGPARIEPAGKLSEEELVALRHRQETGDG